MDDNFTNPILFTALLMAYYRFLELQSVNPLLKDPLAKIFVGNISGYTEKHKFISGNRDYSIIRSYYIEESIIKSWLKSNSNCQIVLLGAGLDTRVYRLEELKEKKVSFFEIDYNEIIEYKNRKLEQFKPYCEVIRIGIDLTNQNWIKRLLSNNFDQHKPTLWILEGLVYYLEKGVMMSLVKDLALYSPAKSEIFVDVCVPGLAEVNFGPFLSNFKWGLEISEIGIFYKRLGWKVEISYAEDHAFGRNVGQKGLIFVYGINTKSFLEEDIINESDKEINLELYDFKILSSEIISLVSILEEDPQLIIPKYIQFINEIEPIIKKLVEKFEPIEIGNLSPRLLRHPLSLYKEENHHSDEIIISNVLGSCESILLLIICYLDRLTVWEFKDSDIFTTFSSKKEAHRIQAIKYLCERLDSFYL